MTQTKFHILLLLAILTACTSKQQPIDIRVSNPKCEMLENPVGIDIREPLLSWNIESPERDVMQSAYRILVASTPEFLEKDTADLWDTGKTAGSNTSGISYSGKELNSYMKVYWKVKSWSGSSESAWSDIQHWSMGPLYQNEWRGRWIGFDQPFPWDADEFNSRLSARYLRKEFDLPEDKTVESATIHIIGLGLYELYLNGTREGNQVLAPAPTNYERNVKYNSFDITDNISAGTNAIGIILGNGRYYSMRQHYKPYKIMNFGYPKLLLNLVVHFTDGTRWILSTDTSWKGTADGPIRSNNEYDGEIYDARKDLGNWTEAGFDDSNWLNAEFVEEPGGAFQAQLNENMAIMDTVHPVDISMLKPGIYILDMGQNMAGWVQMKVKGARGRTVKLRFAESLDENGELFTANLRTAQATDYYTLNGFGTEIWHPSFIYHGFRYVEISGYPGTPTLDDFEGHVVYDNIPLSGSFTSSDTLLNQLYKNAFWSINSNYKGMPVDCPQRNERQPWLGDRTTGAYGESFLFDNSRLYAKWLDDIMYAQKEDGCIPDVAPAFFRYYSDNMTWAGTYLTVAEMLYNQYGDLRSIEKHYPHMKKWLNYMEDRYLEDGIMTKDTYGDWCDPPRTIEDGRGKSADVKEPSQLISTAYYYHYLDLMEEFAILTNNVNDIAQYRASRKQVVESFNRTFMADDGTHYEPNTLTNNLLAYAFELVPEENAEKVLEHIRESIEDYDGHLSTGIVGVQWLMRTLSRNGLEDLAYSIVTKTTYPSWGYMIENGATTIWELWNGNTAAPSMNSQNHVMMLGDLLVWYYEDLAGIKSHPESPAFRKILMKPTFPDGLKYVNASYESVQGKITSNWNMRTDSLYWEIIIPANTTAEIHLPAQDVKEIWENGAPVTRAKGIHSCRESGNEVVIEAGSGHYHFTAKH